VHAVAGQPSLRTGWKVPAPTCSVTAGPHATARASAASSASSKCSAAVGAATAPGGGEHGLVARLVVGVVGVVM
jgi:hypothetical protein